ncbi:MULTISPECIES: flagellar biosynthesis protein FlhB [Marichromatium]|uniref:Flagellar biosynthetic protein FlhB n=1 Tax=Marichromatium gracile TaxID=1048 RepID=A0A4R4A5S0_MARGR|nr:MULTISPECIES: flagellar biosynthesis protein FlhB [Marichromatium]MBK1708124.1 flagellar biosynthesis protein FlhB [Marichromatium gracile]MBO8086822.1 flagellar biosynthesis protein FlhB [Marichromatium sp.]RNE94718.1 flagellar biosynthesis protein FlhB [Marichromatium sp. AB32]TCW33421.1 flagellar biosynthetic protein FlhB [Marichromatium gracile]
MAENENGQEKTEEPTAKRQREAREKGQVPRSREFNTLTVLLAGAGFMVFFGGHLGGQLAAQMADGFTLERELFYDTQRLLPYLASQIGRALLTLAPLFALLFVVALLGPILIGGANFSAQAMSPKLDKLNPLKGIKRQFSAQALLELGKTLAKFVIVSLVAGMVLWSVSDELLHLGEEPLKEAIFHTADMAVWIFLLVSAALVLIAAVDVPFQLWNHNKQLRMTRQELKDEYKETDGKPEVKGRIRQLQQEMASRRMMAEVPKADVVITNPTRYAVAIVYEPARMRAPRLLAKGVGEVAGAIRGLADEHDIIRVEAPRVARAIYFTTDLGEEIPGGLFVAVARILAYVYQLKRHDPEVSMPTDLPVPDEYLDPREAARAARGKR